MSERDSLDNIVRKSPTDSSESETMPLLTRPEVAERFFWHVRRNYRNQTEAADHYNVSKGFISMVTGGHSRPNEAMLNDLGLMKVKKLYKVIEG